MKKILLMSLLGSLMMLGNMTHATNVSVATSRFGKLLQNPEIRSGMMAIAGLGIWRWYLFGLLWYSQITWYGSGVFRFLERIRKACIG